MNSILKVLFLGWILCLTMTSCSALLFGTKKIKAVDEATVLELGDKYNIPAQDSYQIDTAYFRYLFSLDKKVYKKAIQNHYQPLQALYYKKDGELVSFQVNCYAGGARNLDWERDSIMTVFPPRKQAPIDSIIPLDLHLNYLKPLATTNTFSPTAYDYIVIVHWTRFMGRQSERVINVVKENVKLAGEKKVKVVYVNSDNLFGQALN